VEDLNGKGVYDRLGTVIDFNMKIRILRTPVVVDGFRLKRGTFIGVF
jgi:hypothetical protein